MRNIIKYTFLFLISLVVFVVISAPAALVQERLPQFVVSGKLLSGSAWHKDYGVLKWQFSPLSLLTGSLGFDITLDKDNTHLNTYAAITLFGTKKIRETTGNIELSYIKQFAKNIPEFVGGTVGVQQLDIDTDTLALKIPAVVNAQLDLANMQAMGENLGTYTVTITIDDNKRIAHLGDTPKSMFVADITANLVGEKLTLKGNITGRDDAAQNMLNTMGISNTINRTIDLQRFKQYL